MQRQNVCGMLETEFDRNGSLVKRWIVMNEIWRCQAWEDISIVDVKGLKKA